MSFTGTRIENGGIAWNVKKPSVSWPIAGNVSRTFVSKPGNEASRANYAAHMAAAKAAAVNVINEQKRVAMNIGRRYGQEKFKFGIKGPSPTGRKSRKTRKSRKNRKTKRSRR
jgi:hypothetical protein